MQSYYIKEFEHLRISLKEILSATSNFSDATVIGSGGFGRVYIGELSHFKGRSVVAIRRLNRRFGQGGRELFMEIMVLTRYTHENLIDLLGFCDEDDEYIIVFEYASNGSLDFHLSSSALTWMQRIKICLDAARGLSYLHSGNGTGQRILHRDIKSSNILLGENWNAKVSDTGLSKIVHYNQPYTSYLLKALGTPGYCDPLYVKTGYLTKESDVYSFGVLLLEVLCGRSCIKGNSNCPIFQVPGWKKSYKQNKLQEIIFEDLKQQIDQTSLKIYSDVAFQCLKKSREERPTMPHVVEELETALSYQELYEKRKLPKDYKKMLLTAADSLNNISVSELKMPFHKGILVNSGKTTRWNLFNGQWFSRNINGDYCEMISIAECLTSTSSESGRYIGSSEYNSRFTGGCYEPFGAKFKTIVRTQFLSPRITYTVNLVFKNKSKSQYIGLEYKLKGDVSNSRSFISDEREDGWLTAELYQFTSDQITVDLEIWFYTEHCPTLLVKGIEFLPLDKVEHEVLTDDKDMEPISDTDTYWEQILPIDYEDIIKRSKDTVKWKNKKDLYFVLCKGFLLSFGEEWFYLAKDGKKCLILPPRAALEEDKWQWKPEPDTRFEEVGSCTFKTFGIFCKFSSQMLSPQITYAAYLVYKLPEEYESVEQPPPVQVVDKDSDAEEVNIFLRTPQTPVISWNEKEEKTFNPSSTPKIKGLPKRRSDGWMEVQVHEFQTRAAIKMVSTHLKLSSYDMSLKGIVVQGLEFRPAYRGGSWACAS